MATDKKRERSDPNNPSFAKALGRPPEINEELIEKITRVIKAGNYVETAAALNGVCKKTLYNWFRKGQKGNTLYSKLVHAVQQAISESEVRDVNVIDKEARGRDAEYDKSGKKIREAVTVNWKAAAWRLERKHPERWGRREQVKLVEGDVGFSDAGSHDKIMDAIAHFKERKKNSGQ